MRKNYTKNSSFSSDVKIDRLFFAYENHASCDLFGFSLRIGDLNVVWKFWWGGFLMAIAFCGNSALNLNKKVQKVLKIFFLSPIQQNKLKLEICYKFRYNMQIPSKVKLKIKEFTFAQFWMLLLKFVKKLLSIPAFFKFE